MIGPLRSIRWTLQLWHAGILSVALASFGTALYVGVSRARYAGVDAELEGAARVVADRLRAPRPPPRFRPGEGMRPSPPPRDREGTGEFRDFGGPRESEGSGEFDAFAGAADDDFGGEFDDADGRGGGDDGVNDDFDGREPRDGPRDGPGGFGPRPPRRRPRDFLRNRMGQPPGWPRDRLSELPPDLLRRVGGDERDQPYFVVWRPNGALGRASTGAPAAVPAPARLPILPASRPIARPDDLRQFRQRGDLREVVLPGPAGSTVLVGRSVRRERAELRQLLYILAGAGAGVLCVGLAGGWMLSARVVRPIRAISDAARSISASDLSRRIDVDETHSELGSLAQTLNEAFARLEAAFQRQFRFTADASHELRTPLSVIHCQLELSLSKDRTGDEYRAAMAACLRASRRMKSLVDSLLVLARADAGTLDLKKDRVDLKDVVEDCAAMLAPLADEKRVTVRADLHPLPVAADRTRVSQVVTNLLGNAIAYNREGGGVAVTLAAQGGHAVLSVSDTGVGIAEADQPHLFERFYRADKARTREAGGSGLGLAICKSIIEAHGGDITFTSRPGQGTTFTVRLPFADSL
jgi:heavy metal sensor kinase